MRSSADFGWLTSDFRRRVVSVFVIIRLLVGGTIPLLMPPYKNLRLSCQAPFSLLSIMKKALDINIVICYIMFISKKHLVDGGSPRSLKIE
jgi:hypothetical protein